MVERRLLGRLLFWPAVSLLLAILPVPSPAAGKHYRALSYEQEARIEQDGSLLVRERIRIRFDGGPFTFFYRGIPNAKTDGITFLAASDSVALKHRRRGLDVTWRFPAVRDTVLSFALQYRALGAIGTTHGDLSLFWTPFPGNRAYPIDSASAVLYLPGPESRVARINVRPAGAGVRQDPAASAIRVGPMALPSLHTVSLGLELSAGTMPLPRPLWQRQDQRWRSRIPVSLALSICLLLAGVYWILRLRASLRGQREARYGTFPRGRAAARSSQPEDLSPPLVGALCRGGVDLSDALACLFDLAQRGIILVEAPPKRSRWVSRTPLLRLAGTSANLTPWESVLLEAVRARADESGSVSWTRAHVEIQKRMKAFSRAIIAELERRGDMDAGAAEDRQHLYKAALVSFVLSCVLLVGAVVVAREVGPSVLAVPVAAFVTAGLATALAGSYPLWTGIGARRAMEWRGFGRFLTDSAKGAVRISPDRFHAWLPHAVALGTADSWLKAGKRQGLSPPSWLLPAAGADADLTALIAVVAIASGESGGGGGGSGAGGSSGAG